MGKNESLPNKPNLMHKNEMDEKIEIRGSIEIIKEFVPFDKAEPMSKSEIDELYSYDSAMCKIKCKILEEGQIIDGFGTGFFCKIDDNIIPFKRALFTNNHILDKNSIEINKEIIFENCDKTSRIKITKNRRAFTNEELDYTCIEILDIDKINKFFLIDDTIFNNKNILKNKEIFILQYPNGGNLAHDSGKIMDIDIDNNIIEHSVATKYGSSGSPLIKRHYTNLVIGIHFGGQKSKKSKNKNKYNIATPFDVIIEDIKNQLSNNKKSNSNNTNIIEYGNIINKPIPFNDINISGESSKNSISNKNSNKGGLENEILCNILNDSNICREPQNTNINFSIDNDYKDLFSKNDNFIRSSEFEKEINEIDIKFIKKNNNNLYKGNFQNLFGLLKLYLLKEISITDDYDNIRNLPEKLTKIMEILKMGKIYYNNEQEGILKLLKKEKGNNIMNFAKYVDGLISQNEINNLLIPKLGNSRKDILYIYKYLGKYIEYTKLFEQEFERAKKVSIFEYSIISSVIIEREDIDKFEKNRKICPNRTDRILFHGTSYDSISKILPEMFKIGRSFQHGIGIYFTQDLDSCWIYGSELNKNKFENRRNLKIPKVGEYLSFIASAIYYDKNKLRKVIDYKYNPKKNEINFALVGMNSLETINDHRSIDKRKFYGTDFVINDLDQIFPFMGFKLKRIEYCIIWRDTNFSNPVYPNQTGNNFKNYLEDIKEKIIQKAQFNIYTCSTSEEALKLINRKKYNKIILISNIGDDYEGRTFANNARKIIGNNVIVLFNEHNINHLAWVKGYKNALFSNDTKYYEEYLDCFHELNLNETKNGIINLKRKMENHYNVKFNFDNEFLFYPNFENPNKKFKDLIL